MGDSPLTRQGYTDSMGFDGYAVMAATSQSAKGVAGYRQRCRHAVRLRQNYQNNQ